MSYGKPLEDFAAELYIKTGKRNKEIIEADKFIGGLEFKVNTILYGRDDQKLVLTPNGFKQLVKDRLGGNGSIFNDRTVSERTKMSYMEDLANSNKGKALVIRDNGAQITGVLSESHMYVDNRAIAEWLFSNDVFAIKDCRAHTSQISDDGTQFFCRIISPDNWNFGDKKNQYFSGLVINNDEDGHDPFGVSVALAKVSCFNYTLSDNTIPVKKWGSTQEVIGAMEYGASRLAELGNFMHEQMSRFDGVSFEHPQAVFRVLADRMNLPEYVLTASQDYWEREGSVNTIFGIIQALTWGSQKMTAKGKKGKPQYYGQIAVERAVMGWGGEMYEAHQAGQDVNDMVNAYELISKAKVINTLSAREEWQPASELVMAMEADAWS